MVWTMMRLHVKSERDEWNTPLAGSLQVWATRLLRSLLDASVNTARPEVTSPPSKSSKSRSYF